MKLFTYLLYQSYWHVLPYLASSCLLCSCLRFSSLLMSCLISPCLVFYSVHLFSPVFSSRCLYLGHYHDLVSSSPMIYDCLVLRLSCPVSFRLVLSCLVIVLSCLVIALSCPVIALSWPVLSCRVSSCRVICCRVYFVPSSLISGFL